MKKRRFDFCMARELISAYSAELFSEPLFDFYGSERELDRDLSLMFRDLYSGASAAAELSESVFGRAMSLREVLLDDAQSIYRADPAAGSMDEVIFSYPGFFAIMCHRLAHILYVDGLFLPARLVSEYAHSLTGIDIHPGADIGVRFSIDHGTGVVIGETAVIGCDVKIYQGVTIGAKSFPRCASGEFDRTKKRHPTIADRCIIYANATVLGADTVVGEGSVIGANVWLTESVPAGSVIYYARK